MINFDERGEDVDCKTLSLKMVQVCGCKVIVLVFRLGNAAVSWEPTAHQRNWVRKHLPDVVAKYGFGWEFGKFHVCIPEGQRPIDALEWERKQREREGQGRKVVGSIVFGGQPYNVYGDDGGFRREES